MDATRCLDDLDKDFQYKHANDSHSWIIDYPGSLKADPNSLKISSKNETYTEHDVRRQGTKGKRKKLMEAFYRKFPFGSRRFGKKCKQLAEKFQQEGKKSVGKLGSLHNTNRIYFHTFSKYENSSVQWYRKYVSDREVYETTVTEHDNKVISEEMLAQLEEESITVEEYVSDYMESFKNPDDMPLPGESLSKNEKLKKENGSNESSKQPDLEELKTKYPLYFSAPLTYFSQTTGRSHFRKNSTITKSPDQNYDNIEY